MKTIPRLIGSGWILAAAVTPAYATAMDSTGFWSNYALGLGLLGVPLLGVSIVISIAVAAVMGFKGDRMRKRIACVAIGVSFGCMLTACAALAIAMMISN